MAQQASPPARRIPIWVVIALMAAITGALVAAYLLLSKRDMAVLVSHVRPAEAAAVAQELETEGVLFQVADEGTTLLVPADQRDALQLKVAGADLPIKGQEGFELFDSSELGLTEFAQRIKYQRALQGELARTIMRIDGVIEARIHISIPEQSVFKSERSPAKAAVTLLTRSADVETPEAIAGIQQLVAASIPDLDAQDVVVLNGHGAIISSQVKKEPPALVLTELEAAIRAIVPGGGAMLTQEFALQPAAPDAGAGADKAATVASAATTILRVTTLAPLDPADKDRVASLIIAAHVPGLLSAADIRFDVGSQRLVGAPVSVGVHTPAKPVAHAPNRELPQPLQDDLTLPFAIAAGIVMLMIIAGLATLALRQRRSGLSLSDQRQFAERLRLGLQAQSQEASDAAT